MLFDTSFLRLASEMLRHSSIPSAKSQKIATINQTHSYVWTEITLEYVANFTFATICIHVQLLAMSVFSLLRWLSTAMYIWCTAPVCKRRVIKRQLNVLVDKTLSCWVSSVTKWPAALTCLHSKPKKRGFGHLQWVHTDFWAIVAFGIYKVMTWLFR